MRSDQPRVEGDAFRSARHRSNMLAYRHGRQCRRGLGMPNPLGRPRRALDDAWIASVFLSGASEVVIAKHLGVQRGSIHRRLVSSGVPLRSAVEASDLRRFREFEETPKALTLIDGLLLGDASIECCMHSESRLELTQRRGCVAWLRRVAREFCQLGIETVLTDRGERGFQLRTGKYATFTRQRRRWYPHGIKYVPPDVQLAPEALAHWYWGDGSTENAGYRMAFCTDGFSKHDVGFLAERLHSLYGWRPTIQRRPRGYRGFRLAIAKRDDRTALTGLIRPYCPRCFMYKLKVKLI